MQLLEQLACGQFGITESDVAYDCANMFGYLECISSLKSELLTEDVVTEGIGSNIIDAIKRLFKKIKDLLSKAVAYLKRKFNGGPTNVYIINGEEYDPREISRILTDNPYTGPDISYFNDNDVEHKITLWASDGCDTIRRAITDLGNLWDEKLQSIKENLSAVKTDADYFRTSKSLMGEVIPRKTNHIFPDHASYVLMFVPLQADYLGQSGNFPSNNTWTTITNDINELEMEMKRTETKFNKESKNMDQSKLNMALDLLSETAATLTSMSLAIVNMKKYSDEMLNEATRYIAWVDSLLKREARIKR